MILILRCFVTLYGRRSPLNMYKAPTLQNRYGGGHYYRGYLPPTINLAGTGDGRSWGSARCSS